MEFCPHSRSYISVAPVSQERANIGAFKGLISNIPSSVVNIIIPLVAGIAFASSEDPMSNIELYRWMFPIFLNRRVLNQRHLNIHIIQTEFLRTHLRNFGHNGYTERREG